MSEVTGKIQIVGISLVRNEDRYLHRAITNVLDFCDRILIADNGSEDATFEIAQDLARQHPKIEAHRISDPRQSSEMLQPFANTNTWVLGVDGDEIYDVAGLAWAREQLHGGAWDKWWVVFGNVINCVSLDETAHTATGYLAPPCRSMTKLYNFAAVQRLDPDSPQRLMGRRNIFNPGWSANARYELYKEIDWENARFRCLHTCFLPRSSQESGHASTRENITELAKHSPLAWMRRLGSRLLGRSASSRWKIEKYRRGPRVTVDTRPFLS